MVLFVNTSFSQTVVAAAACIPMLAGSASPASGDTKGRWLRVGVVDTELTLVHCTEGRSSTRRGKKAFTSSRLMVERSLRDTSFLSPDRMEHCRLETESWWVV